MLVRIRVRVDGKFRHVDCRDKKCPKLACFSPGYAIHQSSGGNYSDENMSCVYRDYHGCPDLPEGDVGEKIAGEGRRRNE